MLREATSQEQTRENDGGRVSTGATDSPTVLLAERDDELREALAFRLRMEGFDVLEADSTWSLLDSLSDLILGEGANGQACVVIADISMPGLSAFEGLKSIPGANTPALLCISKRLNDDLVQRARMIGAQAVFEVPMEDEALVGACERIARAA